MTTTTNPRAEGLVFDQGLKSHMTKTYNLLAAGLVVSAASAALVGNFFRDALIAPQGGLTLLGTIGMWSPLVLLLLASFRLVGKTTPGVAALYWTFVALQGIGLSVVSMSVSPSAVVQALAVTAATFGAMSLYGYTTRRNLSGVGSFMTMGLFGIIIASIVNLFLGSAAVEFAISVIGVVVFSGLTAWDTQKTRDMYLHGMRGDDLAYGRYWSALGLYLNVLNLYHMFLSLGRD